MKLITSMLFGLFCLTAVQAEWDSDSAIALDVGAAGLGHGQCLDLHSRDRPVFPAAEQSGASPIPTPDARRQRPDRASHRRGQGGV